MSASGPIEDRIEDADPLVSVVIPCFEQEEYVRAALASVLAQTFSDWEAILVDDGSREADIGRLARAAHDPRCRVVTHERNRGLGPARNSGFAAARGRLVLPLDADDRLAPSFLAATTAVLSDHPEADCAYSDLQLFGDSTAVWRFEPGSPRDMLSRQWIPGAGALMRKEVWERVGGYQNLWGNEDWDFWIGAVRLGIKAIRVPEPLYLYRRTPRSMSHTWTAYHEHESREAIHLRHKSFFEYHAAGRRFRSKGYLKGSRAALARGERARAIRLAIRGVTLTPTSPATLRTLLLAVLPHPLAGLMTRVGHAAFGG